MVKILVLFVIIGSALAKPGLVHGGIGHVGFAAPTVVVATPHVVAPTAVSQQSRHDIINPGVITYSNVHAVPVVAAAPVVAAVPAVRVSSAAISRLDVRTPVVASVAAPALSVGTAHYGGSVGGGLGLGGIGSLGGYGVGGYGGGGHGIGGYGAGGYGIGGYGAGGYGVGGYGLGGHGYGK